MVDNVATMVIETSLVQRLQKLPTATSVAEMEDSLVSAIASEAPDAQEERQLASQKLAALEKALQICGQHARNRCTSMLFSFITLRCRLGNVLYPNINL